MLGSPCRVAKQWTSIAMQPPPLLIVCLGLFRIDRRCVDHSMRGIGVGVGQLSAPILIILPIIDIGHFQNRFADILLLFFIIIMQTNILFTGDIIYWWINNTGEIIKNLNALFGSMQPVWAQHSVRVRRSLNLWEQSPPTAHLICRESWVWPINADNWRQSHTESAC